MQFSNRHAQEFDEPEQRKISGAVRKVPSLTQQSVALGTGYKNFLCTVPNVDHSPNPFQLVFSFELFCDIFPLCQLRNKLLLHFYNKLPQKKSHSPIPQQINGIEECLLSKLPAS